MGKITSKHRYATKGRGFGFSDFGILNNIKAIGVRIVYVTLNISHAARGGYSEDNT